MIVAVILLVLLYAWVAYPALLAAFPAIRKKETGSPTPVSIIRDATVVFSAYNEECAIRDRLENIVEELGKTRLEGAARILLGVDAATDRTAELARVFASSHAQTTVAVFPRRRGKPATLKELVRQRGGNDAAEHVLIFTDANTRFMPGALTRLLAPFADPRIGGVCGRLILKGRGRPVEGFYWSLENRLKELESRVDSCLGVNGAIYAVRAALFPLDIPDNTVVDDFVVGMKVREQGFRVVYEPAAVAEEELPETEAEWGRRIRIGAGDYQAMWLCRKCLLPRYGRFAWMFWSHKVLRWFTPHALLLSVLCSWLSVVETGLSWSNVPAALVTVLSALFAVCALVGRVLRTSDARAAVAFRLCDHFLTMQAALLMGFLRFCGGGLTGHWQRTPRQ